MAEIIEKLCPNRDLVCYFQRPSAIAALSATSESGFTLSGTWRQQFDWSVVEWNRDNTFEHPALRNLPDGDLSQLVLTYQESRRNCIPLDSNLYPTVDWPYLRIWVDNGSGDTLYRVRLADHKTAVHGAYKPATASFTLGGTLTAGDRIELAWDPFSSEHYNYAVTAQDTLETAATALTGIINQFSSTATAVASGTRIVVTLGAAGENGNRVGAYGSVAGSGGCWWSPAAQQFQGGQSPDSWQIFLDFSALTDAQSGAAIPTTNVRKMRWTYAADLQAANYTRSEFSVNVSNWTVSGGNRTYSIAGAGSRRIENDDPAVAYSAGWAKQPGNFSNGTIQVSTTPQSTLRSRYLTQQSHHLYLGTRKAANCGSISVAVDGVIQNFPLQIALEDFLVRIPLGVFAAGSHEVILTHTGGGGTSVYFDFLELAVPAQGLPAFPLDTRTTLATDWDTDHSIALPPERTAWLIQKLGFHGRANHYVGALWFFEMRRDGHQYASATVNFQGSATPNAITTLSIDGSAFSHLHLAGDTAALIAKAFELQVNNGATGVWAAAQGSLLTLTARVMGAAGNAITIAASTNQTPAGSFTPVASGATMQGGVDGAASGVAFQDTTDPANIGWRVDTGAALLVNRAARDWSRSFFAALAGYGIQATAAFSTELQFVDPSALAGLAQRYPSGSPVTLTTPAIQTNFSPVSRAFWQEVYAEMAQLMADAGQQPFVQFGEVQWWYFPDASGMPFYDAYTTGQFEAQHGRALPVFPNGSANPAQYPQETAFLSGLIGDFTQKIAAAVQQMFPGARFEVLYPPDTNSAPLNPAVNLPAAYWTPSLLSVMKTENFSFTGARNLDLAKTSVALPLGLGFARNQSSHLVGISDPTTPWRKEADLAISQGCESVVLFALDQYCLIGYPAPYSTATRRSLFMG